MNDRFFHNPDLEVLIRQALHCNPCLLGKTTCENLPDWQDVNALLGSGLLDYPRIRISGTHADYARGYCGFLRYGLNPRGGKFATIIPDLLYQTLADGCTVIIDGCQDYFPAVLTLTNEIGRVLNCQSWANLYISAHSSTSFGCHFDDHDIISVQLSGAKEWRIFKPTYVSPNRGDKSFYLNPPTGTPDQIEHLSEGESLYLPSGYWHDVTTVSPYSLHITFGLDFPRKLDIVRAMANQLGLDAMFRGVVDFPLHSQESDRFREQLLRAFRALDFDTCMRTALELHGRGRPGFDLPKHRARPRQR
jgi:hypothetical protein